MVLIALEFDKPRWTPAQARKWMKDNDVNYIGRAVQTAYSIRYDITKNRRFKTFGSKRTAQGIRLIFGFL